jgi:chromosome segregation ATPase
MSEGTTITYTGQLKVTTCWCGIELAIPENLYRRAHDEGASIYCPLGHTFVFTETTKQRLERQLQKAREARDWAYTSMNAARDQARAAERSKAAMKGHLTRMRNKVANGVCPVTGCRRHFDNVQDHIRTVHDAWLIEHDIEIGALG